jgi:hypothetical protein
VGEVDFLQLLDNWRQLLRYEIAYRRIDASLRQTLAELERVVGGFIGPHPESSDGTPTDAQPIPPGPEPNPPGKGGGDQPPAAEDQQPLDTGDQKPGNAGASAENVDSYRQSPSRIVRPVSYRKEK